MRCPTNSRNFEQSAPPDSGGERCSFLLIGGASKLAAAAKRRGGLEHNILAVITIIFVLFAFFWSGRAGDWEFASTIGLSGLFAPFIGSSIYWLATSSLNAQDSEQEKAGKCYEAISAACQLAVRLSISSFKFSVRRIFDLLHLFYAIALKIIQRILAATANLAHIALSPRLLVIPAGLR